MIEDFFKDIDQHWKESADSLITLKIIGSAALHLQCTFQERTKDGDILELEEITLPIRQRLEKLAGKGSVLSKKHHLYIDFVKQGFPFLPATANFSKNLAINKNLQHFKIEALDITDVVVAKLAPFRAKDIEDIQSVVELGLIDPHKLLERFLLAKEQFLMDSRANQLKSIVENLNRVQRDFLFVEETPVELPDWIDA